jgi:conflict system STAND superfamily ATPase/restriction endonuclease
MRQLAALSDVEFEALTSDLLRATTGNAYERFGVGPDGGIDLRFVEPASGKAEIVQCKHYVRSSFSQLLSAAKKEVPKLEAMDPAPDNYRFITSQSLTGGQKEKLMKALDGWITDPGVIWGAEQIEDELNAHSEVERNHVKLWLSSSAQLEKLLNAGTMNRSNDLIERVTRALPRYVQTRRFHEAEEMLEQVGVCLIAGEPGIGKTTLAQMLLLDCAQKGSQAFYYDDFLGRIGLSGLGKNEDQRLVDLIARAHRDPKRTRLILTTREYILRSAVALYGSLERAELDHDRFLLALEDYSRYERGLVLYNHLYHSGAMRPEWLRQLVETEAYLEIIDHPNYNPRLIEFITGHAKPHELEHIEGDWVSFARAALDHPEEIWKRAFDQELDDLQRLALTCLIAIGDSVKVTDLAEAVKTHTEKAGGVFDEQAFENALEKLEITFVAFGHRGDEPAVDVANPSISDFVLNVLAEQQQLLHGQLQGACFFAQPRQLIEVSEADQNSELSKKMTEALKAEHEDLAAAMITTIDSEEPLPGYIVQGGGVLVRQGAIPERRLKLLVDWCSNLVEEGQRGEWLAERLRALVATWRSGQINQADAVALHGSLVQKIPALGEVTGSALKSVLESRLYSADDFEHLDSLWRSDSELFTLDERNDLIQGFSTYAEEALHEELGSREISRIEHVANDFGVSLDEENLEDARDRASDREEDWDPDVDEDRDEPRYEEEEGDDEELGDLFERLTAEPEPEA